MELRHLRYFLAVAEHLHFRRAAQSLSTSQPSLSLQIRTLEEELGMQLFERSKRSVRLTAAGQSFARDVHRIMADLEAASRRAADADRGTRGELTIATTPSTLMSHFPQIVRRFRATYPDVVLRMRITHAVDLLDALLTRRLQLGFVQVSPNATPLLSERLWEHEFVVAIPADHAAAGSDAIALSKLRDERLIVYSRTATATISAEVSALCNEQRFVPREIEEVSDTPLMLGLIACGDGIAIVPDHVQLTAPPGVLFKPLSPASPRRVYISACWHRADDSPLIPAFINMAREMDLRRLDASMQAG